MPLRPYSFRRIINYYDALTTANAPIKRWRFVRRHHFIFAHVEGVCDTPLRFSRDVGTTVFLHLGLRDCFTIQDELANGEHSSAGCQ